MSYPEPRYLGDTGETLHDDLGSFGAMARNNPRSWALGKALKMGFMERV
jgi:hypothetical protein